MIYKNDETRKNVLEGAEILYDAVKTTLGPKGRNVLIRDKFGGFTITHDGVTVAKAVKVTDDPKSVGIDIIKEASKKMDQIGDGTTTVTVLAYHLIKEAEKLMQEEGLNPMMIKRELEKAIPYLVDEVKKHSKKIEKNFDDVKSVASVSVGNDELGEQIATLMTEVGFDGAISVETTQAPETTFKKVDGFSFDRGYMSPYFITSQGSREAVLKNPAIIVVNGVISDLEEYKNVLDPLFEQNIKNVLIVAENIEPDQLGTLILNKVKGVLNVVAVKAPGYGEKKLENLKDIAKYTGATLIEPGVGDWQDNLGLNTLGAAQKVVVGYDETIIMGGQGKIDDYVEKLKRRFKKIKIDERGELEERIARLKGSVGIIKVGGQTETEVEEKKYRIDDAVAAARAAMKSGIVAGGGITLLSLGDDLVRKLPDVNSKVALILKWALEAPNKILLENSGIEITEMSGLGKDEGINVVTGEKVNMFEAGIVDPAEVTIEVVRNAITTAALAITVGGSIVEKQLSQSEMTQLMSNVQ